MANNLVLGRGKVYFDRFVPGTLTKTGERYLGATPAFSVSAETQELDHYSSEEGLQVKDESVTLRIDYSGALTCENMSNDNTALFFFGDAENTVIGASVADSENFDVKVAHFYQLGATDLKPEGVSHVSNVVVNVDPTGTPVLQAVDVDYSVDLATGRIEILVGGGIANDDTIGVVYDVAAQTQDRVISGTTLIQGAMRFISFNGVGNQRNFYMPKVTLRPNGEFALKGEEWQSIAFNIEILQAGNLANLFASGTAVAS